LLIADEPTTGLDVTTQKAVMELPFWLMITVTFSG
jgi:ABC-type dipeptide/oligopeptide/nickel transport system ATPase component